MAGPVIDVHTTGPADSTWAGWRERCPPLPIRHWRRLIVVAAHPDDEILGAGGLLALAAAAAMTVTIVVATDGEASHPGSVTHDPARLARLRAAESRRAATELGLAAPLRLGLPDGRLAEFEHRLTADVRGLLGEQRTPGLRCVAPWRHDGHPDHEAAGRAAAAACASIGARLLEYPVWMWQWADPDHPRVRRTDPAALSLTATARAAKHRALHCFPTQTEPLSTDPADAPILPGHILRRFTGPTEIYFR
ncbi:PIG-L deacetylase family protein [Nocardia sp. alder85J]|uniref:PIG-L deacetylase family protein n=1 Tax=Nocardia sp. alder85J TaxID=2862949 RepID=UPI001CD7526B|nr:PIG-L family deacetylase [Nocardia sp. alder85J]MCX4098582.1 PIG-L family deacetylase [Nocardia sp. alder85J]